MARKNIIDPFPMFGSSGADLSQSTVTSQTTQVPYMDNIGIIVNWTGTSPVGVLYIDASLDSSTWVQLDFGTNIAITGNSGSHAISLNQLPYKYVRARYVRTSGTGTLFANLMAKQVGG